MKLAVLVAGAWSVLLISVPSAGAAPSCDAAVAEAVCTASAKPTSRAVLKKLDQQAREYASHEDFTQAANAFACLLKLDATAETAMNLAVVAEAAGNIDWALKGASCAEQLGNGKAREAAEAERKRLELLAAPAEATQVNLDVSTLQATPPQEPISSSAKPPDAQVEVRAPILPTPRHLSATQRYAVIGGAVALAAGAILILAAHAKADEFQARQRTNGYDDRAKSLRSEAATLQVASGASAIIGTLTLGLVVLTF